MKSFSFFDERQFIIDYKSSIISNFILLINSPCIVMINRVEKLSLLSEMIEFARIDKNLKEIEYQFLLGVSKQLDIAKTDFEYLLDNPVTYVHLKSHSERIVQFHRLMLLMNLNEEMSKREIVKLHNFGLRMGLGHEAISRVLDLMGSFPNKIVPPDFLIDIFKTQYN